MLTTNTGNHAQRELDIIITSTSDSCLSPFYLEILAICEKFGNSGQSGGSAPFVATTLGHVIKKLCLQEPISDITGLESEWVDMSREAGMPEKSLYQNNRCGAIFKEKSLCYYLDAIVFKDQKGHTFTSSMVKLMDGSVIGSKQFIKGFPFKPKTFYIDVIGKEVAKDDWEYFIRLLPEDERHLNRVWRYYDRFDNNFGS